MCARPSRSSIGRVMCQIPSGSSCLVQKNERIVIHDHSPDSGLLVLCSALLVMRDFVGRQDSGETRRIRSDSLFCWRSSRLSFFLYCVHLVVCIRMFIMMLHSRHLYWIRASLEVETRFIKAQNARRGASPKGAVHRSISR
jgi:hypothetical protein